MIFIYFAFSKYKPFFWHLFTNAYYIRMITISSQHTFWDENFRIFFSPEYFITRNTKISWKSSRHNDNIVYYYPRRPTGIEKYHGSKWVWSDRGHRVNYRTVTLVGTSEGIVCTYCSRVKSWTQRRI